MIDFRKARFVTSAVDLTARPKQELPAILMVGRSNVGKSTLINALLGQKIAFSSKKAGKTKLLNYFEVDSRFYLVDSPGYGSTSYATLSTINFAKMMEDYVKEPSLKAIVLLLDLKRDLGKDDEAFIRYLEKTGVKMLVVLTKVDQMNQSERHKARLRAKALGITDYLESELSGKTTPKIRSAIANLL
ncbi:MAG: ribosome biogenesis GTP-binding protein YihA/YsxC [Bacilli bacterium]|nr:ribosome biogenesis GTP-binding protein YihA/YsxC [Bacilli bacterium]